MSVLVLSSFWKWSQKERCRNRLTLTAARAGTDSRLTARLMICVTGGVIRDNEAVTVWTIGCANWSKGEANENSAALRLRTKAGVFLRAVCARCGDGAAAGT